MPITRHFDAQHNFVLTKLSGLVDEGIIRLHLKAMNEEAAQFKGLIELADCRQIEAGCRSVHDLVETAALERGQPWATEGRLTIVVSQPVVFGMARVYLAGNEGVRTDVHVTYSLEEAIARLQIDPRWIEAMQA
jgi:hypothetical protein